ncbi:hypothetical protein BCU68_04670 [Vibrio sp. 10N.286.49.B3]|uniref:hypothetical protein n=1 Tax=Vibrio sp. 10N.286.49.B3 TaxID=1880855 RepID=UPI000C822FA0|nr:hypothetical protein [Vibrio sp. 10N.286.49.B3]PMH40976.1 hypothetical protein BCU68_04670 [Vibrio sp. 10N.286.49.B3]
MKLLISLLTVILFSSGVYASTMNGSGAGSSATGPNVECMLPDGSKKYIPALICKHSNGHVSH